MIFALIFLVLIISVVMVYYNESTVDDIINTAVEVKDTTQQTIDTVVSIKNTISELGEFLK